MTISGTLVVLGTDVTNPDPNILGTISPGTFSGGKYTPSAAWIAQAKPALFPLGIRDGGGDRPIQIHFVPSAGGAATYTVTAYQWNRLSGTWIKPDDYATFDLTGSESKFLENAGDDPWFLQLSSISSGTVAIYHDAALARAL